MKTNRWKKRMAVMLILLAGGHMTARPEVIITGILDGTLDGGCPKVIELFVSGTEDLNYYEVWRSLNGAPFGSGSGAIASMSGTFTNTFVYLVKTDHVDAFHDVFGNEGIFANVVPMGIINGNGNDGFQVRQKVGSVVIDQVWLEDATDSYRDSYWYRKHGTGPDGGWLSSAWETPGNDALDGLDQDGLLASVPFGTYAMAWNGITSDWNDAGNWSLGIVPSFQTNVLIRDTAANFPVITNLPAAPAACMNLTVADTAKLTVEAGKALTVHGDLALDTIVPGETERGLILDSDSSQQQSGSLILGGNATGTAIIKRFIEKDNSWHFLSSPVDYQDFQPVFVPSPIDNSFDLYYWDENNDPSNGWINARNEAGQWNPQFASSFIPGRGYLMAFAPSNSGQETRTFSGLPFSGNFCFPIGHAGNYWNLLGNPYTCALDWFSAGIAKDVIAGSAMYIWDPSLNDNQGGYRVHNGTTGVPEGTTAFIPAMQGFFVQSLDTGSFNVNVYQDDPLVHGNQSFYKNTRELAGNRIRLKIRRGQLSDETLVCFDERATNDYDPVFDAEKLFNGYESCPEIYSAASPDHRLVINTLGQIPASVNLGLSFNLEENLVLYVADLEGVDPSTGIFLEDRLVASWIDLRNQQEYQFAHNPMNASDRFVLHFMNTTGNEDPVQNKPEFWCYGDQVYISNPGNIRGNIAVYSVDGKCLLRHEIRGGKSTIAINFATGLYIIGLSTPTGIVERKIFINK